MKLNVEELKSDLRALAAKYAHALSLQVDMRLKEMSQDDKSHYMIYQLLGIAPQERDLIDVYQNKGRFLYKYAGTLLEKAAILCFEKAFPDAMSHVRIPNLRAKRPKTFEIDCLVGKDAYEIKWRDATTDGDHITKEQARLKSIQRAGYTPIRLMFYYPNRAGAIRIQQALEAMYEEIGGCYHFGPAAWEHLHAVTGIDLHSILSEIAEEQIEATV